MTPEAPGIPDTPLPDKFWDQVHEVEDPPLAETELHPTEGDAPAPAI